MNFWDFARGPASVKVVLEFGLARGFSQDDLLARSRIAPQHLQDPNFELSALQELRVVENLLRLAGHPPGLGLQVGQGYRFSTFGLWGYGLVCSATVGEAMARALRFIPLSYAFSMVEQRIEDGLCLLQMRPPDLAPGLSRFLVERDLAAAASLVLEVGGPGLQQLALGAGHLPAGNDPKFLVQVPGAQCDEHIRRIIRQHRSQAVGIFHPGLQQHLLIRGVSGQSQKSQLARFFQTQGRTVQNHKGLPRPL